MKKEDYNIKTKRLELKLVKIEDARFAFEILQKFPEITKYLPFKNPEKVYFQDFSMQKNNT